MSTLPPGSMGLPVIGETLAFLRSPFRFLEERQHRYGDVFKSRVLFRRVVFLSGIEGAEAFYDDDAITRTNAHPFPLVDLFGGDNMEMLDGEEHLALKTIALAAFDEQAFARYVPEVQALIDRTLARGGRRRGPRDQGAAAPRDRGIWTNMLGPPGRRRTRSRGTTRRCMHGLTSVPVAVPGAPYARARAARDRLLGRIRSAIERSPSGPCQGRPLAHAATASRPRSATASACSRSITS